MNTTLNMALTQWTLVSDFFNHAQLSDNWDKVDIHDHSPGRGVQIPEQGLANASVSTAKLQDGSIVSAKYAPGSVGNLQIADLSITTGKLALLSVGTDQLMDEAVTQSKVAPGAIPPVGLAVVPRVKAYNSSSQPIGNGSTTTLRWNNKTYDTDNMHSTTSNTSRLTVNTPGAYVFGTTFSWDVNSSGHREVIIRKNGGTWLASSNLPAPATPPSRMNLAMGFAEYCNVGDYVEVLVYQNSGGPLNVGTDTLQTFGGFFVST